MSLTIMQEYEEGKEEGNNKNEYSKWVYIGQMGLRATAFATSLAASCLTFTNKEVALVYDVPMDAKYSYSSAFKFFAFATVVSSGFALLSLIMTLILRWKGTLKGNLHFLFFLHDLAMTIMMVGGTAGAAAIGYVGEYGMDHAGWVAICDNFHGFCHRSAISILLGFSSSFCFFILTIISAIKSSRFRISSNTTANSQVQHI